MLGTAEGGELEIVSANITPKDLSVQTLQVDPKLVSGDVKSWRQVQAVKLAEATLAVNPDGDDAPDVTPRWTSDGPGFEAPWYMRVHDVNKYHALVSAEQDS